jgi:MinD-like ATPase involved in chromosome partitioning or flagellar assembly
MSVITFYSYKGGVGRTMALANVAVLLARTHRVLVVDWDLQAPGIERFFAELHIEPEAIGLLPLLTRVASGHRPDYREYISQVAAVDDKLAFGLLHSGRGSDPGYYHKLEHFNWTGFYKQGGGDYLERLREQCLSDYDFVLIDSRTGLSDAGGVCTIQMPDIVVAVFTPTRQSLYGVRDVMRLAQAARQRLAYDRSALSVVPVPSRVDRTQSSYGEWRELFAKEMAEFLAAWLPRSADRAVVLDRLAIDHAHEVSHGERLVTFPGGRYQRVEHCVRPTRNSAGERPRGSHADRGSVTAEPARVDGPFALRCGRGGARGGNRGSVTAEPARVDGSDRTHNRSHTCARVHAITDLDRIRLPEVLV